VAAVEAVVASTFAARVAAAQPTDPKPLVAEPLPAVVSTGPPVPIQTPQPTSASRVWSACKTTVKFAGIAFVAWFVTVLALIAAFRFVDPPQSMLMLTKRLSGETLQHDWVPLDKVALNLRRAVITSEDAKFCRHWGFDLGEIRTALASRDGYGRGASTITQQLAKNLFLWPGKSYVRKGLEVPLTLAIEGLWPKRRILEVYLNFAEWGPGVFGAEAASQYYYNKPVAEVSEREAALLAISLPNPIARDASDPGPKVVRRAATLQSRMRIQGVSYCALSGSPGRLQGSKPVER
jgi:monofunctional glycosyltransferase